MCCRRSLYATDLKMILLAFYTLLFYFHLQVSAFPQRNKGYEGDSSIYENEEFFSNYPFEPDYGPEMPLLSAENYDSNLPSLDQGDYEIRYVPHIDGTPIFIPPIHSTQEFKDVVPKVETAHQRPSHYSTYELPGNAHIDVPSQNGIVFPQVAMPIKKNEDSTRHNQYPRLQKLNTAILTDAHRGYVENPQLVKSEGKGHNDQDYEDPVVVERLNIKPLKEKKGPKDGPEYEVPEVEVLVKKIGISQDEPDYEVPDVVEVLVEKINSGNDLSAHKLKGSKGHEHKENGHDHKENGHDHKENGHDHKENGHDHKHKASHEVNKHGTKKTNGHGTKVPTTKPKTTTYRYTPYTKEYIKNLPVESISENVQNYYNDYADPVVGAQIKRISEDKVNFTKNPSDNEYEYENPEVVEVLVKKHDSSNKMDESNHKVKGHDHAEHAHREKPIQKVKQHGTKKPNKHGTKQTHKHSTKSTTTEKFAPKYIPSTTYLPNNFLDTNVEMNDYSNNLYRKPIVVGTLKNLGNYYESPTVVEVVYKKPNKVYETEIVEALKKKQYSKQTSTDYDIKNPDFEGLTNGTNEHIDGNKGMSKSKGEVLKRIQRSTTTDHNADLQDYEIPQVVESVVQLNRKTNHQNVEAVDYEVPEIVEVVRQKSIAGQHASSVARNQINTEKVLGYPNESKLHSSTEEVVENGMNKDQIDLETGFLNVDQIKYFLEGSGLDIDDVPHEQIVSRSFAPLNSKVGSLMAGILARERPNFKTCFTQKNENGNCMPIQICPVATNIEELLSNICFIDEVFIGVCCPEFPVETIEVDWGSKPVLNEDLQNQNIAKFTEECGKLPPNVQQVGGWPWVAPLVSMSTGEIFCGGVLISELYVLTAAHCTTRIPPNRIAVHLQEPDSGRPAPAMSVSAIKRHAHYEPRTLRHDLALLRLSRAVSQGPFRRAVCLPTEEEEEDAGRTAMLMAVVGGPQPLSVLSREECSAARLGMSGDGSVLCTEPRIHDSACNADSGAPLVVEQDGGRYEVIGVLSWNRNDCDGRYPTIFSRLASYRGWIEKHATLT